MKRARPRALPAQSLDEAGNEASLLAASGVYRHGLRLSELSPGECGTVRCLLGVGPARLRLMEMGLTPGAHVRVLRAAAFGGPLDLWLRGYQLSLRRDEAAIVWLDDEDAPVPDLGRDRP